MTQIHLYARLLSPPTGVPLSPRKKGNLVKWQNVALIVALVVSVFSANSSVQASSNADVQPSFPIRAAFYYPWFPEAWTQLGINPYTNYHPSIGFYDSSAAATIIGHIAAMQYGGIQAGILSWWGQGSKTDQRVPTILSTTTTIGSTFRWSIYYEQESLGNPTVSQINSDLTYIQAHYGNDPSFLRINGRFVVFVYADGTDNCTMADRWKQANTVNAYIVLKVFAGYQTCASQPDGWHQYGPATAADSQGKYSYAISPGFWKVGESPRLARDLTRWNTNVRDMVASGAQFQLITTFSEWGEGTSVESAQEWASSSGYGAYLDALHNNGQSATSPTLAPAFTPTKTPTTVFTAVATNTPLPISTSGPTKSTATTFTPSADATVRSSAPSTNYGKSTQLRIDSSPIIRSYLRFDVQGLSSPVTKAILRVYASSSSNAGYKVYKVSDTTWGETTITYNNAPPLGSLAGSMAGFGSNIWTTVDITSLITGNSTISLALTGMNSTAVSFVSRDGGQNAPQLVITTLDNTIINTATPAPTQTTLPANTPTPVQTQIVLPTNTLAAVLSPTPLPTQIIASPTGMPTNLPSATSAPTQPVNPTNTITSAFTATIAPTQTASPTTIPTQTLTPTATATKTVTAVPSNTPGSLTIQHVFVVIMENHSYSEVWNTSASPYITSLGNTYARATNYHATTHPSLPNYLDLYGGSNYGITTDCNPSSSCHANAVNLADNLDAKGLTWKGYMESMPSPCYLTGSGTYAPKHNPMVYFDDIYLNTTRCKAHDVPYTALATDLASASTTPNYSMIVPNLCNDMHDCSVSTGDTWLKNNLPAILNSPACTVDKCLLILTWDEDDSSQSNQVLTIFAGPAAKTGGATSSVSYTHFSLLRTIENIFGLPTQTSNDAGASPMTDLLR